MTTAPHPAHPTPPAPAPASTRWPRLAGLALGVLLAHAALLTGLPAGLGGEVSGRPLALTVRQIVAPMAPITTVPAAEAQPAAPARPAARPPTRPRAPVPVSPDTPTSLGQAAPETPAPRSTEPEAEAQPPAEEPAAAMPPPEVPAETAAVAEPAASATAEPAPAPPAAPLPAGGLGEPPPTYATRVPPAATLRYELRRGLLTGQGDLKWRPAGAGYELTIEGTAFGLPLLTWISQGGFDAAGLAPQRFVDRRRNREGRAANFQRDRGLISFSSSPVELPLLAGAQDRLSWMVQLAAVVDAAPERYRAGDKVAMVVAGARGDVDVWTFAVTGREAVDVVGQRIDGTLALRRAPRKAYDTQVEVWLDPGRHHLPVRMKLSTAGGDDSLEFVLRP